MFELLSSNADKTLGSKHPKIDIDIFLFTHSKRQFASISDSVMMNASKSRKQEKAGPMTSILLRPLFRYSCIIRGH